MKEVLPQCFKGFKIKIIVDFRQLNANLIKNLSNESLRNLDLTKIQKRLAYGNNIWFYIIDELHDCIIASYWAIIPKNEGVWHDSFFIQPHDALLCNAFVNPKFRRLGFYEFLIQFTHTYLLNYINCRSVYTIVEKSNYASLSANRKSGVLLIYRQFLLKIFGINVISIIKSEKKIQIRSLIGRIAKIVR